MKRDILILHGALGAIGQFEALKSELDNHFTVHGLTFSGHGGIPESEKFGIRQFADELRQFLDENRLQKPIIFAYSMGGYVALYAASEGMDAETIITLGTKMHWSPEGATREISLLQPDIIEEKVPAFAAQQASLHAPLDWKKVMQRTAGMMIELGNEPILSEERLARVECPVYCLRGDQDKMVNREETHWAVDHLPQATYIELSDTQHPIERVNPKILAHIIISCLK